MNSEWIRFGNIEGKDELKLLILLTNNINK